MQLPLELNEAANVTATALQYFRHRDCRGQLEGGDVHLDFAIAVWFIFHFLSPCWLLLGSYSDKFSLGVAAAGSRQAKRKIR